MSQTRFDQTHADEWIERIDRAVFAGNKTLARTLIREAESENLLSVKEHAAWWKIHLVDDEDERLQQLEKAIRKSTLLPYQRLAKDIQKRDGDYLEEYARTPPWQRILIRARPILLILFAVGIIASLAAVLVGTLTGVDTSQRETLLAATAAAQQSAQATQSILDQQDGRYLPVGEFVIESVTRTAETRFQNGNAQPNIAGAATLNVRYTFICGTRDSFCTQMPAQGNLLLRLSSTDILLAYEGLLPENEPAPPQQLASGARYSGSLLFPIPNNATALALIIDLDAFGLPDEAIPLP